MEDLGVQVLQGFGVKCRRIVKEKSYYVCNTDKGIRVIKKSMETEAHVYFEHEIKEHLKGAGFSETDRYYLSLNGKPFVEHDDNLYVMTDYFNYRDSDFANNKDFFKIINTVAVMHRILRDVKFKGTVFYGSDAIVESFKKNVSEFSLIKRRIGTQTRMSDFDVLFIKNYDYYVSQMKESISLLSKINLGECSAEVKRRNIICHNLLKEEHLLHDANKIYITAFSQANIDSQINDICSLIQRYAKALPQQRLNISEILEAYDKINRLSRVDLEILYALLRFPYKYVKICNQFYIKKRTWTPNAIINRMNNILQTKDEFDKFLNGK